MSWPKPAKREQFVTGNTQPLPHPIKVWSGFALLSFFLSYRQKEHLHRDLPKPRKCLSKCYYTFMFYCCHQEPFLEVAMLRHYHTVSHKQHHTYFALCLLVFLAGFTPTWTFGPLNRKEGLKSCPDTNPSREEKKKPNSHYSSAGKFSFSAG